MPELNWPRVLLVAILALGLFFGANCLYQNYFRKAPFLEQICSLEAVASAELVPESGGELLLITPEPSYRGLLQDLLATVEQAAGDLYRKPLRIEFADQRSARLDRFAAAASPALFEAARSGRYREAAAEIERIASLHELADSCLTVDARYLYLQARDNDGGFLYQIVPLPLPREGDTANA